MKRNGRALAESLTLHGLLVGAMLLMAGALTPPPPTIRLDFSMLQPAPAPKPAAAPQEPAVAAAPPEVAPTPPAPQPEPVTLPQKLEPAAAKVKHAIRPVTPEPQSQEQNQPQVPETPAATTTSAPVATGVNTSAIKAPAVAADEEYRQANFTAIRDSILANLRYPMLARRRGWSGQVEISFKITPDGSVSELRIVASSGFSVLDDQAMAAIRHSAPFSPPPRIAAILVMPVNFQLN